MPASRSPSRCPSPRRVSRSPSPTSPGGSPWYGRSRPMPLRGRGLQLVAGLSRAWGVRLIHDPGKTVWAVLDRRRDIDARQAETRNRPGMRLRLARHGPRSAGAASRCPSAAAAVTDPTDLPARTVHGAEPRPAHELVRRGRRPGPDPCDRDPDQTRPADRPSEAAAAQFRLTDSPARQPLAGEGQILRPLRETAPADRSAGRRRPATDREDGDCVTSWWASW